MTRNQLIKELQKYPKFADWTKEDFENIDTQDLRVLLQVAESNIDESKYKF